MSALLAFALAGSSPDYFTHLAAFSLSSASVLEDVAACMGDLNAKGQAGRNKVVASEREAGSVECMYEYTFEELPGLLNTITHHFVVQNNLQNETYEFYQRGDMYHHKLTTTDMTCIFENNTNAFCVSRVPMAEGESVDGQKRYVMSPQLEQRFYGAMRIMHDKGSEIFVQLMGNGGYLVRDSNGNIAKPKIPAARQP